MWKLHTTTGMSEIQPGNCVSWHVQSNENNSKMLFLQIWTWNKEGSQHLEGFVNIILKNHLQAVFKVKKKNIETGTKVTRKQNNYGNFFF